MAVNSFSDDDITSDYLNRDRLLKQLILEVQKQDDYRSKQQLIVARIADTILRSRPLCRSFKGQPLTGVYKEIYERVKLQLEQALNKQLEKYELDQLLDSNWVNQLQNQTFKQILDDNSLKKLGLAAQKYPLQSELRSHALTELIKAIELSGRLCRPHREKFSPQFYQILYEEAVSETFTYVCLYIDRYDPERGGKKFMNWVNFRLDKLVLECRRKFSHWQEKQLPSLVDLEQISQPEERPFLSELLYQCIEEDIDNLFQQTHIRNCQQATFKKIALARLSGKTWEEIAQELDVIVPTLSSFFQRCCRKFAPLLKQKLQS
jgi:hypothetical protein